MLRPFLLACLAVPVLFSVASGDQYAFLVGVRDYSLGGQLNSLKYSENDVQTLANALFKAGLPQENVVLMTQSMAAKQVRFSPRSAQIRHEFELLLAELEPGDSVIVGFSGHGVQFQGDPVNYFCPIDADLDDKSTLISLTNVYDVLESCKAKNRLLLVDACRNDPLNTRSKTAKRIEIEPIGRRKPPVFAGGTMSLFSCSPSQESFESSELESGVFFHFVNRALVGEADQNDDRVIDLMELESFTIKRVQKWTRVNLGQQQIPERRGTVRGDISVVELDLLARQPSMHNSVRPSEKVTSKSFVNSIGVTMQLIPKGSFMMGSKLTPEEAARRSGYDSEHFFNNEHPRHRVAITKPFYIARTELTQGQWLALRGTKPWRIDRIFNKEGNDYPATRISWEDAVDFCRRLSAKEGRSYRLPTEAEWEYACRAGTDTVYASGDDDISLSNFAWFSSGSGGHPYEVGRKQANGFGLFDMHGNVEEWCGDWYVLDFYANSRTSDPSGPPSGSLRVCRGGSWRLNAGHSRSANRSGREPTYRDSSLGFRLVCVDE